jgi:hypothetical protein
MNYEAVHKENNMSTNQTEILQAKRRARDYWSIDGLPTIFHALAWLMLAGMLNIRRGTGVVVATMVVLCVLTLLMFLAFRETEIIQRLKARTTYPRTGYVKPPELDTPSSLISLSITREPTPEEAEAQGLQQNSKLNSITRILSLAQKISFQPLFVSALIINRSTGSILPQAAVMILMGVSSLVELRKNKLAWIDVIGLVLAGLAIAFLPTSPYDRINLMFLTPGLVLALRGTLTFLYYLRRNPVVQA